MDYKEFLKSKEKNIISSGFIIDESELNPNLFDFQAAIVKWALARGRAAVFAGTGLGKTIVQLDWAYQITQRTGHNVLIVAPLSVSQQTIREGNKFGIDASYCRHQDEVKDGITITNYEMIEHFDLDQFIGVVLDESSILKNQTGKVRSMIIDVTRNVPYKLSCTATPAPNDYAELGSQCEFLGIMTAVEMLAMFFIHDTGGNSNCWRIKGHGKYKFWQWMAGWSVFIQNPSNLGFDGSRYILPPLNIIEHMIETNIVEDGLFVMPAQGLSERRKASRRTLESRCDLAAEIVNSSEDCFLVWCYLNDESAKLKKDIHNSDDVKGSDTMEKKENALQNFIRGDLLNLVSKPKIFGYGINLQHCHNMVFVGLNDSWEAFYQAVRRCYRFGQTEQVNVHIITTDLESNILNNIKRKEEQAEVMMNEMAVYMANFTKRQLKGLKTNVGSFNADKEIKLPKWI